MFVRSGVLGEDFRFGHFQRDYCYGMTGSMYQYEGKVAKNQLFFRDKVPENRVSSKASFLVITHPEPKIP